MATRKTPEHAAEAIDVMEGEELVTIKLPLTKDEQGDVFVRVNRRTWQIKRGEYVRVPACVVEVLDNAETALQESIAYQNANQRVIE